MSSLLMLTDYKTAVGVDANMYFDVVSSPIAMFCSCLGY